MLWVFLVFNFAVLCAIASVLYIFFKDTTRSFIVVEKAILRILVKIEPELWAEKGKGKNIGN